jgi:hypothetical protein
MVGLTFEAQTGDPSNLTSSFSIQQIAPFARTSLKEIRKRIVADPAFLANEFKVRELDI